MRIDLQLHSTYSDGYLSPTELADFIHKDGVKVAALTDHNTVRGTYEFRKACEKRNIKAITGMELYVTLNNHKFNLLWYNFDESDPRLHDILRMSQQRRKKQMRNILIRMKKQDFQIDVDKIIDSYNHYVPINHVIDDIIAIPANLKRMEKQLKTKSPRENDIISEYFHNKKNLPTLKNSHINIKRIMDLRKKIGGQIILCHPAKQSYINKKLWTKLKRIGLDGIELLSPHHSYGAIMYMQHLAKEFNFIETGGSDFHKIEGNGFPLKRSWDYFQIESTYLHGIEKIINHK
jgi:predicted metal-dependent phosphoesterase TrpH